ncbi:hypothetical protein C2W62_45435, partial [Candidatus Entotheonella serta]
MADSESLSSQRMASDETDPVELMCERGMTDGMPVVPPTEARVQRMLNATNRDPKALIGVIGPGFGRVTVEKIAINAVMVAHGHYQWADSAPNWCKWWT